MFYCTNLCEEELAAFTSRKVERAGQTYSDFKMEFPLQLEYIEMNPEDDMAYFSMASISPGRHYYASLTREEMRSRFERTRLHHHSYYELLFVVSGQVFQVIENKRHLYTPGSCCLLNKNVLHAEEHDTAFQVVFLGISDGVLKEIRRELTEGFFDIEKKRPRTQLDRFLEESLSGTDAYEKKYMDFIPLKPDTLLLDDMTLLFRRIARQLLDPQIGSTHRIKALVAKLMYLLSDPGNYETKPIQIGSDAENVLYNQIDRIMQETNGRATRGFLESELHYSGDYLNKITKKYTGLNIHDFGMTICMGIAARELISTTKSIGEIAEELGFSNRTHFYKQFEKRYHLSPAAYRRGQVSREGDGGKNP